MSTGSFGLPAEYQHRDQPAYFDDESGEVTWQPDVYAVAATLAERTSRLAIVDLGCGSGAKLAALGAADIIAVDLPGPNLESAAQNLPGARVIAFDLLHADELPIDDETLHAALIVSSDVIEHLPDPAPLLRFIARAVHLGALALLSTPERRLTWGAEHMGPPPNEAHCREWALDEFLDQLSATGLQHLAAGITRSNDASPIPATILVAAFPSAELADENRSLIESVAIGDAVAALTALRDAAVATQTELDRVRSGHDESEAWHEQHLRDTEDWYRGKVASLEAQLADVSQRLNAELDHRDRVIGELRAINADLERTSRPRPAAIDLSTRQ